jgi:putative ABC transport system permease protein
VLLLLRQFTRPVLLANVLAWPVCWYLISRWLASFNHRIELAPWFAGTAAAALLATVALAWLTVAGHAIRMARGKPATALRYQ